MSAEVYLGLQWAQRRLYYIPKVELQAGNCLLFGKIVILPSSGWNRSALRIVWCADRKAGPVVRVLAWD